MPGLQGSRKLVHTRHQSTSWGVGMWTSKGHPPPRTSIPLTQLPTAALKSSTCFCPAFCPTSGSGPLPREQKARGCVKLGHYPKLSVFPLKTLAGCRKWGWQEHVPALSKSHHLLFLLFQGGLPPRPTPTRTGTQEEKRSRCILDGGWRVFPLLPFFCDI